MTDAPLPTALPPLPWTQRADIAAMLTAIDPDADQCRYVGGAVRDSLIGAAVKDIDLATTLLPETVLSRLKMAGIKAVPTGIAHGTVTAVLPDGPVEITTLRRDVETDGRRATIAFSSDWQEDASRRDFTINAIYGDPHTLALSDYFGGLRDLQDRQVRFIGDAEARIREDYLRILRFFRFQARFGNEAPDPAAMAACTHLASGLKGLSRERVAMELLAILALPDPILTLTHMEQCGIWAVILPELAANYAAVFSCLVTREGEHQLPLDAITRLSALLPPDPKLADKVGAKLRLSRAQRSALITLSQPWPGTAQARHLAADMPAPLVRQWLALRADKGDFAAQWPHIHDWQAPRFPLTGKHIIARGIEAGPAVAQALQTVRKRWISEDFPDDQRLEEICDAVVAQQLKS